MLTCSDLNERHELGQQGHEHNFKRFLKKTISSLVLSMCVTVEVRQEMLEEAQRKLMNLLNSTEGKIDK